MKEQTIIQNQLSLFAPISIERANELLNAVNLGRKKDLFHPVQTIKVDGYLILVARNKEYGHMFNVVDMEGNIPKSMSACWRNFNHIKQELKLE